MKKLNWTHILLNVFFLLVIVLISNGLTRLDDGKTFFPEFKTSTVLILIAISIVGGFFMYLTDLWVIKKWLEKRGKGR